MRPLVLVIDDSRAMRIMLGEQLDGLGIDVLEAENGQVALRVLGESGPLPVAALVDWNMPELNGLEFIRAVRADERLAGLRLLVVTSQAEAAQMVEALAEGADEYLMKPFSADALSSKLSMMGVAGA